MKRLVPFVGIAALCLSTPLLGEDALTVHVQVIDLCGNQPMAGVEVTFGETTGGGLGRVRTSDAGGHASFELPAGPYDVSVVTPVRAPLRYIDYYVNRYAANPETYTVHNFPVEIEMEVTLYVERMDCSTDNKIVKMVVENACDKNRPVGGVEVAIHAGASQSPPMRSSSDARGQVSYRLPVGYYHIWTSLDDDLGQLLYIDRDKRRYWPSEVLHVDNVRVDDDIEMKVVIGRKDCAGIPDPSSRVKKPCPKALVEDHQQLGRVELGLEGWVEALERREKRPDEYDDAEFQFHIGLRSLERTADAGSAFLSFMTEETPESVPDAPGWPDIKAPAAAWRQAVDAKASAARAIGRSVPTTNRELRALYQRLLDEVQQRKLNRENLADEFDCQLPVSPRAPKDFSGALLVGLHPPIDPFAALPATKTQIDMAVARTSSVFLSNEAEALKASASGDDEPIEVDSGTVVLTTTPSGSQDDGNDDNAPAVTTPEAEVSPQGTAYLVHRDAERRLTFVYVGEGRVLVAPRSGDELLLGPGEGALAGNRGARRLTPSSPDAGFENDTNRVGSDYDDFDLERAEPRLCYERCRDDEDCAAWTYVKPGVQGRRAHCYLKNPAPAPSRHACCVSGTMTGGSIALNPRFEVDTNRVGGDYAGSDLETANPQLCFERCENDSKCAAWTFVRAGVQGPRARCYLKNPAPAPVPNGCCVSGAKTGAAVGSGGPAAASHPFENDTNRLGSDYADFVLPKEDPRLCAERCRNDNSCRAWTYVKPGHHGTNAHCFLKNPAPKPTANECCVSGTVPRIVDQQIHFENDTNRYGSDYADFDLAVGNPDLCFERCKADARCAAWTFVRPGVMGPRARCYLKDPAPPPSANGCCVSGVIPKAPQRPAPPAPPPPPPAVPSAPPPAARGVDWYTSAKDHLNSPDGSRFSFTCPPFAGEYLSIWGTDVYTFDSGICLAGVHTGAITKERGGVVTIEMRPGQSAYPANVRYGVSSQSYGAYHKSFAVVTGAASGISRQGAMPSAPVPAPAPAPAKAPAPGPAKAPAPAPANARPIGWYASAAEHVNSPDGSRFSFVCPPFPGEYLSMWGTDVYTFDSGICMAGVHAGVIGKERGGWITIEMRPGQATYPMTLRNGVSSQPYGAYHKSFAVIGGAAGAAAGQGATSPPPPPGSKAATWQTQGTDHVNVRAGSRFSYHCPRFTEDAYDIWGTDVYTYDSGVCLAGVHAGAITKERGGVVTIEMRDGQDAYRSSTRNGVTSKSFGMFHWSFAVVR